MPDCTILYAGWGKAAQIPGIYAFKQNLETVLVILEPHGALVCAGGLGHAVAIQGHAVILRWGCV